VNVWGANLYGCAKCCPSVGSYSVIPLKPEAVAVRCRQFKVSPEEIGAPNGKPIRFTDLDKGDQLQIMKDCNERAVAEVSAHFDKTYGETIERLTNENIALNTALKVFTDRAARFRELQSEARRKDREQVLVDNSWWDD
jgi:hypothetical protein